jgi:hypothetical protein
MTQMTTDDRPRRIIKVQANRSLSEGGRQAGAHLGPSLWPHLFMCLQNLVQSRETTHPSKLTVGSAE